MSMCSCTHESPFECDARLGCHACTCSCHKRWRAAKNHTQPEEVSAGPREPLAEKDAEIARLQERIAEMEKELCQLCEWYRKWVPVVNEWQMKNDV